MKSSTESPFQPMTGPVPIGVRPADWNLTVVPPPPGYNAVVPPMYFHDFYNLRSETQASLSDTAEKRNLQAWKDANYRLPLDTLQAPGRHPILNLELAAYEFGSGFLFGSVFAVFTRGPITWRFFRRVWKGQLGPNYAILPTSTRMYIWYTVLRRAVRVPMLFGVFQLLLRGMNPTINGWVAPWITGCILIGLNHLRTQPRRMKFYRFWGHMRSLGNIHSLEYRPILEGTWRDKWTMWLKTWPRWFRRRLWRGMFIIFMIEILLLPFEKGEDKPPISYYMKRFFGFHAMASPTFGPDPVEVEPRSIFKRPEEPVPTVDGSNWYSEWLAKNNHPDSGAPYVIDQRMFHADSLKPVLEDTPDQNIKFDHTAIRVLDTTPAFYLGQQDWRSSNAPTGRHSSMVQVGALPDGRYVLTKICLETLVQNMADNDPRWIDPSMTDIAGDLLTKASEDERVLGKIIRGEVLTDSWEEAPHRPLIIKDWNRREERQADEMIAERSNSIANLPIWGWIERAWDATHSPNPPTYRIEDGPNAYHNLSDEEMDLRRQYVLHVDPHSQPEKLQQSTQWAPTQFWSRLNWRYISGHNTPPGLPEELASASFIPYKRVYTKSML